MTQAFGMMIIGIETFMSPEVTATVILEQKVCCRKLNAAQGQY